MPNTLTGVFLADPGQWQIQDCPSRGGAGEQISGGGGVTLHHLTLDMWAQIGGK